MLTKHAHDGMGQERPPITMDHMEWLFEEPDFDDGKEIRKRIGRRTLIAYYSVNEESFWIRSVSRTTGSRL